MSRQLLRFGAVWLSACVISVVACSGARTAAPPAPVASCGVFAAQPGGGDTLSLATMAAIDPAHVPEPTNAAERLVFAQLYETLIDVDCEGRAQPGLAASWVFDETRTRVTFTLRDAARFSSGRPVTAAGVLAAWRATGGRSTVSGALAREIADRTTVVDTRTLIVSLPDTAWLVLANRALAVYEPQGATGWPDGSGPYHVSDSSLSVSSGALLLAPSEPSTHPYLLTHPVRNGDPRDAIDADVDVLVTGDPLAVGYAAARPNLTTVSLPWTRTYVLAVADSAPRIASMLLRPDSESLALRGSLAHDAVHAQARAAQPPYWWEAGPACGAALDSSPASRVAAVGRSNRIVYRRDDPIARGLAERLVALDARAVVAALAPNDFTRALRDGGELAYVLDLPHASLSPCENLRELQSSAPWLAGGRIDAKLIPLVDTRETAILNRDRVAASIDWRGTLHFGGMGKRP